MYVHASAKCSLEDFLLSYAICKVQNKNLSSAKNNNRKRLKSQEPTSIAEVSAMNERSPTSPLKRKRG